MTKIVHGGDTLTSKEICAYVDKLDDYIEDINNTVGQIIANVAGILRDNSFSVQEFRELSESLKSGEFKDTDLDRVLLTINEYSEKSESLSAIHDIKSELSDSLKGLRDATKVLEHRRDMFDLMSPKEFMEKFPNKDFTVPSKLGLESESERFSDIIYNLSVIKLTVDSKFDDIKIPDVLNDYEAGDGKISQVKSEDDNILDLSNVNQNIADLSDYNVQEEGQVAMQPKRLKMG